MKRLDGDGVIDLDELYSLLRELYPLITYPEVNRVYQSIDVNRSGNVTFDEYVFVFWLLVTRFRFVQGVLRYRWDLSKMGTLIKAEEKAPMYNPITFFLSNFQVRLGNSVRTANDWFFIRRRLFW